MPEPLAMFAMYFTILVFTIVKQAFNIRRHVGILPGSEESGQAFQHGQEAMKISSASIFLAD
jgi:hypothetical protein